MNLPNFNSYKLNDKVERLVNSVAKQIPNPNHDLIRIMVTFYLNLVASSLNTKVVALEEARGTLPVNMYSIVIANSGTGKTYTSNILEEQVLNHFIDKLTTELIPTYKDLWVEREVKKESDKLIKQSIEPSEEIIAGDKKKEINSYGYYPITFDTGTPEALRQVRNLVAHIGVGSVNFINDELGRNLSTNSDIYKTYLNLYDKGLLKSKIIKNTDTNIRYADSPNPASTNMLVFGTGNDIFDASNTEKQFFNLLESGFIRRTWFYYSKERQIDPTINSSLDEYIKLTSAKGSEVYLNNWSLHLGSLATVDNVGLTITWSDEAFKLCKAYELYCKRLAEEKYQSDDEDSLRNELINRTIKVIKLSAMYSLVLRNSSIIEPEDVESAIAFSEYYSKYIEDIYNRPKDYQLVAEYLVKQSPRQVGRTELMEKVKAYNNCGSEAKRKDLMTLALSYAYEQGIPVEYSENAFNVGYWKAHPNEPTNLDKIPLSINTTADKDNKNTLHKPYNNYELPFFGDNGIEGKLLNKPNTMYCNHSLVGDTKKDENVDIHKGTNFIVLDVDGTDTIELAKAIFSNYQYLIHTTKSHGTKDKDSFRILLPLSSKIKLSKEAYKEFMNNIYDYFPIKFDRATKDRARGWFTNSSSNFTLHKNSTGSLLNPLPFIPNSKMNEEFKKRNNDIKSKDNLIKYFVNQVDSNELGRNNALYRFACVLNDSGLDSFEIKNSVVQLNSLFHEPLDGSEVNSLLINFKYAN